MVHASYETGKEVFAGRLDEEEGAEELRLQHRMNKNSAKMHISAYCSMMGGVPYHWPINKYAMRYYLESIFRENGREALRRALASLDGHIENRMERGYAPPRSQREVYREFYGFI